METIAGRFLVICAVAVATSSCLIIPIPESREFGRIESSELDSLVGNTKSQVLSKLGHPDHVFASPRIGESYYVYVGSIVSHLTFLVIDIQPHSDEYHIGSDTLCYLLVFDTNQRMVRYDAQRGSDADCPNYFWSSQDVERMFGEQRQAEILELTLQAETGDTKAAYALYEDLSDERQTFAEAWGWLCMAANGGNGEAQRVVGNWHRILTWQSGMERLGWLHDEVGIQPDNRVAYMWYTLAASSGNSSADASRESVATEMTPDEIAQAEQVTSDWKLGDCPSAEHRLGLPT